MPHPNTHNFFTTLTFKDGEYSQVIETQSIALCRELCSRFCLVKEHGSYGTNPHMHIYGELKQPKRTDKISDRFKKLYKKQNIFTNQYTIRTLQENDTIYRVGYYMQKETSHEMIEYNINTKNYKELYERRTNVAEKLIKKPNYKKYKIDEIPTAYFVYCDSLKLDRGNVDNNLMSMIRDDMIQVTQFKSLKSVKLKILIKLDHPQALEYFTDIACIR